MTQYVEYTANNSGGHWWLDDEDWAKLEAAGWKVAWSRLFSVYEGEDYARDEDGTPKLSATLPHDGKQHTFEGEERWLGALAHRAYRVGLSLHDAASEWERITGKSATDAGCPCCGQPHSFTLYVNGKYAESGPHTSYEASW